MLTVKSADTQWKQQRLWALRPRLSFSHMLIFYVILGIIFVIIAFICYLCAASTPKVIRLNYTDCTDPSTTQRCKDDDSNYKTGLCKCELNFNIDDDKLVKGKKLWKQNLSNV